MPNTNNTPTGHAHFRALWCTLKNTGALPNTPNQYGALSALEPTVCGVYIKQTGASYVWSIKGFSSKETLGNGSGKLRVTPSSQ